MGAPLLGPNGKPLLGPNGKPTTQNPECCCPTYTCPGSVLCGPIPDVVVATWTASLSSYSGLNIPSFSLSPLGGTVELNYAGTFGFDCVWDAIFDCDITGTWEHPGAGGCSALTNNVTIKTDMAIRFRASSSTVSAVISFSTSGTRTPVYSVSPCSYTHTSFSIVAPGTGSPVQPFPTVITGSPTCGSGSLTFPSAGSSQSWQLGYGACQLSGGGCSTTTQTGSLTLLGGTGQITAFSLAW